MVSDAFVGVRNELERLGRRIDNARDSSFVAQCPAHEDGRPSLSVRDAGDRVLLHCFAGCFTDEIANALGMELADLFDGELDTYQQRGMLVRSYEYQQGNGEPWYYVDRYFPKTFRQRLPGVEPVLSLSDQEAVQRLGLRGRQPILYNWPQVDRAIHRGSAVVWWLDGEKDVETAKRMGLVATCPPGFAKWRPEYADRLQGVAQVVMVVDQDPDKKNGSLGAGPQHAKEARAGFRARGLSVKVLAPKEGKDFTDHVNAGHGIDDFVPEPTVYTRPRGLKADALMGKTFDPLVFPVHHILPVGLSVLAGSPKAGKTWLALGFSLAVAAGGPALSCIPTTKGSVLHLAREDGYRRLQSRIDLIMAGEGAPPDLELVSADEEWIGGDEGLANMTEWAEEVDDPRLVVIDTLAKVEPDLGEEQRKGMYTGNYSMMSKYKAWADRHNVGVLVIHHDRKSRDDDGDPFTRISGTRGITGAADTLLFLEHKRGEREGVLHVTGRDVNERAVELVKSGPIWNAMYI